MRILLSWLREFVDVPGSPDEIALTMSARGFSVEGLEPVSTDDTVIDVEVTANRPDCLSVIGIAREVATAYGLQVRRPAVGAQKLRLVSLKTVDRSDIDVGIENPDLCARYAGAVADVTVGPSPDWMQARLHAAGVRPISNIVDVTNYVLIELGHPMHAFDLASLAGSAIRVRTARPGETLRTLDGQMRVLSPEMLVIADAERPTALAGVMGGAESEVSQETKAIVLESAYFNPLSVRRTSRKLGLKTEASIRFERGADPRLPVTALERAAALLELVGAGRARGTVVDRYPTRAEPGALHLRRARIEGLLGAALPDADVKRILDSLGFAPREAPDGWDVTVPTRRIDVLREVDLIEEVARHYGFDRLPVTFPPLDAAPPLVDPRITRARQLRAVLTAAGFSEAVTFGFMAEAAAAPFAAAGDLVAIANPLSESFAVLRPSALPGLINAVAHNRRRQQRDVRLFEIGSRFTRSTGERRTVACAWTGTARMDHWSDTGREVDFFDIKGLAERICAATRVEARLEPHGEPWLAAGRTAALMANGGRVGVVGQLTPAVVEAYDLPAGDPLYVTEIDLDALDGVRVSPVRVEPLPRYPSVTRDISMLIDDTTAAVDIRRTIRDAAPATLVGVREFDRYQGRGIPDQKVSLSFRLTFRSSDRTLTDAEVQAAMDAVIAALQQQHGAVQR